MKKFIYSFIIVIFLFGVLLLGGFFSIKDNLWTKIPNAKVFDNGEASFDSQVYVSKDGDYLLAMRSPEFSGTGLTFVYPQLERMGIGGQYWEVLGYVYTKDDYRSHIALSGTAKFGGSVKIENELIELRFDSNRTITICLNKCLRQ